MAPNKQNALKYVRNTGGGATRANFIDDFAPVGRMLWEDVKHLIKEDENGRIYLTEDGKAILDNS